MEALEQRIDGWIETCDPEIREMVRYQMSSPGRRIRPLAVLACNRATGGTDRDDVLAVAAAVELLHNYVLIVNDIIDRRRTRRQRPALHVRYGRLPALMVGGYLAFAAGDLVSDDSYATILVTELGQRIAASECHQWRVRDEPFGADLWRSVADANSGATFAACASLAARDGSLTEFGRLLGVLYHGCSDVADMRVALAGEAPSDRALIDRLLTLPAAVATDDPEVAGLYRARAELRVRLTPTLVAALAEAEKILDELADAAEREARATAAEPKVLVDLVQATRTLSVAERPYNKGRPTS